MIGAEPVPMNETFPPRAARTCDGAVGENESAKGGVLAHLFEDHAVPECVLERVVVLEVVELVRECLAREHTLEAGSVDRARF